MGLMMTLSSMYEKPSANNKVHPMKKLFNLKMVKGAAMAKHLNVQYNHKSIVLYRD